MTLVQYLESWLEQPVLRLVLHLMRTIKMMTQVSKMTARTEPRITGSHGKSVYHYKELPFDSNVKFTFTNVNLHFKIQLKCNMSAFV